MGTVAGNVLTLVRSRRTKKIYSNESMDVAEAHNFYRPGNGGQTIFRSSRAGKGGPKRAPIAPPVAPVAGDEISRIKALENELSNFRCMLDQMVRHKTEMLERRLSILESCNSTLGENYHKMHMKYLDLLIRARA